MTEDFVHRAFAALMVMFQIWMCVSIHLMGPIPPMKRHHRLWRVLFMIYVIGKMTSSFLWYLHPQIGWVVSIAADLALFTLGSHDDDWWKKLWGKIQGQALTAVNALRFSQQVKECS